MPWKCQHQTIPHSRLITLLFSREAGFNTTLSSALSNAYTMLLDFDSVKFCHKGLVQTELSGIYSHPLLQHWESLIANHSSSGLVDVLKEEKDGFSGKRIIDYRECERGGGPQCSPLWRERCQLDAAKGDEFLRMILLNKTRVGHIKGKR